MKWGLVLIALLVIPSALAVKTWNFQIATDCDPCVEGMVVNTSLVITNTGDEALEIARLTLRDSENLVFFTSPLKGIAQIGNTLTVNFPLHLPPASRGSTLFYKPCIQLPDQTMCADNFGRMFVRPLKDMECSEDTECAYNEVCEDFRCLQLQCTGRAVEHECRALSLSLILDILTVVLLAALVLLILFKA